MNGLAQKECVPCKGGIPLLKGSDLKSLLEKLEDSWQLVDEHHLEKEFKFENFRQGLDFTIKSASLLKTRVITLIFILHGGKSS
tara:strand:+ start:213 stop:464 length:252 start_codon:yes stop_codon:yes gene_type:complete